MTVPFMLELQFTTDKVVQIPMEMDILMLILDGHLPMVQMYSTPMPRNGMILILMDMVTNQLEI